MTFKQSLKLVREVAVQNMEKCVLGRRNSHARTLRQEHANPLEEMLKSVCLEQGRLGRLVRYGLGEAIEGWLVPDFCCGLGSLQADSEAEFGVQVTY